LGIAIFALVYYPDSYLVRPHPIFWRFMMGTCTAYLMFLLYLVSMNIN